MVLFSMRKWYFTAALGLSYLALFHLWLVVSWPWALATGTAGAAALTLLDWRARARGCFVNDWDAWFHGAVILDIFLEGWLITAREGFGFYWCAASFGVVLTVYRLAAGRAGRLAEEAGSLKGINLA
jgi:hypothetical protein